MYARVCVCSAYVCIAGLHLIEEQTVSLQEARQCQGESSEQLKPEVWVGRVPSRATNLGRINQRGGKKTGACTPREPGL